MHVFENWAGLVQLLSHLSGLKHGIAAPDEGEESYYGVRCRLHSWMDTDIMFLCYSQKLVSNDVKRVFIALHTVVNLEARLEGEHLHSQPPN